MNLSPKVVVLLRALLVLMFAATLLGQLLSWPGEIADTAREGSPLAPLRWPLTVMAVLGLVCVQVVIVATWKLLTMVQVDRIFSASAFAWVDTILYAICAAWTLLFLGATAIVTVIYFTPSLRDPGVPIMLGGIVLAAGVVVLLMLVMRVLLRRAAALRSDLDEVI